MPVLPGLQVMLDQMASAPRPPSPSSVAEARAQAYSMMESGLSAMMASAQPLESEIDHSIPVEGGTIVVRAYTPPGAGPFAAHVYFHGGGFWLGTLEHSDNSCRALAADVGCVVLSVDYRLAPEAKFPTPAEDCYAALLWVAAHVDELGIDPLRLSVGGGSAGGNLAAVVALMSRDRGGPPLVLQVLEIPVTDLTMSQPSIEENAAGPLLTKDAITGYVGHYLADPADATNPYASPLLADDLTRLPPAIVMTAEFDPLRDEGEAYARRLADAGVRVELVRWPGQFHGSQGLALLIPDEAADYHHQIVAALRREYGL